MSDAEPASPWAFPVGRLLGIPIRVHATFLLLLVFFGWMAKRAGQSVAANLTLIVLVFACVVLHELGHAATAKRFGVRTREIVLYPIGGIARLENIPGGRAEILIALAGPAVNLVLTAILLLALAVSAPHALVPAQLAWSTGSVLAHLMWANLWLCLFNLIPAFPMDGGRVLRAALSLRLGETRATRAAAGVAQVVAVGFGAAGLFSGNVVLLFIALFVYLGAAQEVAFVESRAAVAGRTAREGMITRFDVLRPQDTLGRAAELLLATHQQDFPVVDAWGRAAGILPRGVLLKALASEGRDAAVLDVMRREPAVVAPDTPLDEVLQRLQAGGGDPVLVMEGGALVGMVTLDNLAEFIEVSRSFRRTG